jgi:hypothetical protein
MCCKITNKRPPKRQAPAKTQVSPFKRRKRTTIRDSVSSQSPSTAISTSDLLAVQHAMSSSGRAIALGADKLRSRTSSSSTHEHSAHKICPSGAALRKSKSIETRAFLNDISVKPCVLSSDEAIYVVKDLAEFVRKIAWFRDKEV